VENNPDRVPCAGSNAAHTVAEIHAVLTPSIDHLFDRGFVGFEDSGDLIVSPVAHTLSLQRMGVETHRVVNVGGFSEGQRRFLDFHRNAVLLRAVR
jgi:putative restriction endonuclease